MSGRRTDARVPDEHRLSRRRILSTVACRPRLESFRSSLAFSNVNAWSGCGDVRRGGDICWWRTSGGRFGFRKALLGVTCGACKSWIPRCELKNRRLFVFGIWREEYCISFGVNKF